MNQATTQNDRPEKHYGIFRRIQPLTPAPDVIAEELIARALPAQRLIEGWTETRIDQLLRALAQAVADHAEELAVAAVAETGMGNVRDKTFKNRIASLETYAHLVGKIGHGVIGSDSRCQITEVA